MNGNDTARTVRDPLDFYPTPTNVTEVFRGWLASHIDAPSEASTFLDPAAGDGHLIRAMRGVWGASRWTAIEIDPVRASACFRGRGQGHHRRRTKGQLASGERRNESAVLSPR